MKCIICGEKIMNLGNNPDPLTDEHGNFFDADKRCCDLCNDCYVIPYRLAQICNNVNKMTLIQKQVNRLRGVDTHSKLIAVIEKPDGSTYTQEIEFVNNSIEESIKKAQKELGNPFAWYTDKTGKRQKYIKPGAYVIVDAYVD